MGRIALPNQDFSMSGRAPVPGTLDLHRAPHPYTCLCGEKTLLLLPQYPGALVWQCPKCHRNRRVDFKQARTDVPEQAGAVKLARTPIWHICQTCGEEDVIALPLGAGEIRWECKCESTWVIVFTPDGGKLAKVV